MITGEFTLAAVSSVALMVLVPIVLTAGNANWFSFASAYNACNSSPNNTPGLYFFMFEVFNNYKIDDRNDAKIS
jgi:hypothetical protein